VTARLTSADPVVSCSKEETHVSEHRATIRWKRESPDFTYDSYNRAHRWEFEAGVQVPASSSPDFKGDRDRVDPEQAFVAALSSCHMLTFLALAARRRLVVDAYEDEAAGFLEKNADGKLAMTRVVLRPKIELAGAALPEPELAKLHELAHAHCFIANSVRTEVSVEPR
jgi:organic hydroperoxide reductase OsmC/OhrA